MFCVRSLVCFGLLSVGPCYHTLAQNGTAPPRMQWQPNVVLVQFEPAAHIAYGGSGTGLAAFDRRAAAFEVNRIARAFALLDHVKPTPKTAMNLASLRHTYYVRYRADVEPPTVARALAGLSDVVYAEPVPMYYLSDPGMNQPTYPNDSLFSAQTHLKQMRLPEAWDVVKSIDGNPQVVIAIVDGGADWRHPDLEPNVWTNEDEIPGNGIDDDDNGFIDDIHGVNFANGDSHNNDPTGLPTTPMNARHGTAVAGVANAVTDNGIGVAGAAWNAKVMHINAACQTDFMVCSGYEGLMYAAANGAAIVNASWSSNISGELQDPLQHIRQILNLVTDMGTLVVAASGNSGQSIDVHAYYPARHPRVLSVGATHKASRRIADFSNVGRTVDTFAPGVDINLPVPDNGYGVSNGTSFASPLAAGVAALVKTRFPNLGPDALREQVRMASDNIDAENPDHVGNMGRGYVNALASVQAPTLPAVRLKRWSWTWTDHDGDDQITVGDVVTVNATFVNHLADAQQLSIGLTGLLAYPFLDFTGTEVQISTLDSGDSVTVALPAMIASDIPQNSYVQLLTRIRYGNAEDTPDRINFIINDSVEAIHTALSALYTATGGDNWRVNTNWDINNIPTWDELLTWHGLLSIDGWLTGLYLPWNELLGELPAEFFGLSLLQDLSLPLNSLTGPLPKELENWTSLRRLDLSYNHFRGTIPKELGNLPNLQVLRLNWNILTGPIPKELGNLPELTHLALHVNQLSGEIPAELGNLSALLFLEIASTHVTGSIPPELGRLSNLVLLDLNANALTGQIPKELGKLSRLKELHLGENSISGEVPAELGELSSVKVIDLSYNKLTGQLPISLTKLSRVIRFHFGGQALCAPKDPAFQAWLSGIENWQGPTCTATESTAPEELPEDVVLHGNFPNPFRESTTFLFDLKEPAEVQVTVIDLLGRIVLSQKGTQLNAGMGHKLAISGDYLTAGAYLYRLRVRTLHSETVRTGTIMHIR